MSPNELKKIIVIQKYIEENFSEAQWAQLGTLTNSSKIVDQHPRLLRSLDFGDTDYAKCVGEVLIKVAEADPNNIESILDVFSIESWYKQKHPESFERIFGKKIPAIAQFWKNGYFKIFISHLAVTKGKAAQLKSALLEYGISGFVAHDDIEPAKEWMAEIELGLNTMEALIAMVEPDFKNSDWTDQEVGFALAREVEIIPLIMGANPYGFMGKYQGIQAKGRIASDLAKEVFKTLIKKSRYRGGLLSALYLVLKNDNSKSRVSKISLVESFNVLSVVEMKELLENASLGNAEKLNLTELIKKYGAFKPSDLPPTTSIEDDLPF